MVIIGGANILPISPSVFYINIQLTRKRGCLGNPHGAIPNESYQSYRIVCILPIKGDFIVFLITVSVNKEIVSYYTLKTSSVNISECNRKSSIGSSSDISVYISINVNISMEVSGIRSRPKTSGIST